MERIDHYFPDLTDAQRDQLNQLDAIYREWNAKINVISRKDIDQFETRHLLHSLAIGLFVEFKTGSRVLDVGTGGGFPGIPLAILFPETQFTLVDSIGKKIKVVNEVVSALGLKNVKAYQERAENVKGQFDYVVSRAVTRLTPFYQWINNKLDLSRYHNSGFYGLKGGDLSEEIKEFQKTFKDAHVEVFNLSSRLKEDFFETKKIVAVS